MSIDRSQFKPTPYVAMLIQNIQHDAIVKKQYFDDYIFNMNIFLKEEQIKIDKEFNEGKNMADPEYIDQMLNFYEGVYEQIYDFNPGIFYNSVFLALNSYLEIALVSLAQQYMKLVPVLEKSLRSNIIKTSIDTLDHYLTIRISPTTLSFFEDTILIRNCIAHYNGYLLPRNKFDKIKQMAPKYDSIEISEKTSSFKIKNADILFIFNQSINDFLLAITQNLKLPV